MIRREVFKQFTQFTYILETDEDDEMRRLQSASSKSWRTILAIDMEMFRNSTTLWSIGMSRTLMISSLERNFLSHRRL